MEIKLEEKGEERYGGQSGFHLESFVKFLRYTDRRLKVKRKAGEKPKGVWGGLMRVKR